MKLDLKFCATSAQSNKCNKCTAALASSAASTSKCTLASTCWNAASAQPCLHLLQVQTTAQCTCFTPRYPLYLGLSKQLLPLICIIYQW